MKILNNENDISKELTRIENRITLENNEEINTTVRNILFGTCS